MTIKLSSNTIGAVKQYADIQRKAVGSLTKVVDALVADGFNAPEHEAHLRAPKSGEDGDVYEQLKNAVIMAMTQSDQTLLNSKTADLSDADKAQKRYVQQQVGSRCKDIRNAWKSRIMPKPERVEKDAHTKVKDHLLDAAEIIRKNELEGSVEALRGLRAALKALGIAEERDDGANEEAKQDEAA